MVEAYTQLREQERPEVDLNEVDYNPEVGSVTHPISHYAFRGRAEELSELMAEGLRYGRTTARQSGLYPYDEDTRQSDIPRDDIITHANKWLVQESEFDYQTLESVMNAASLQDGVDWAWEQLDGPIPVFNLATFLSGANPFNPVGDIFTGDFEWGRTPDRLKGFRPNPYADQSLGERTGIRNWGDAVYAILDVIDMAALVMGGEVVRPIWNALKKTDDPLRAWGQVVEAYRPPPIHGGVAKTGHSQELIDFYSTSRMIDNIERPGRKGRGLSIDEVALSQSDRALDPVRYTEMPYTSIPDGQMDAFFEHWDSIGQEAPTIWVRTDLLEDYGHGFAIKEAEVAMRSATAAAPPAAAADATARAEMQAAREAAQEGLPGTPQGGVAAWEGGPTLLHGTGNDRLPRRMQTDVTGSRIPGLYATDSLELAERYAGTEGFVHNLQWTGDRPPRVLDVSNDPVSPELKQAIIEAGPAPAYVTRFDGEGEWAAYVEAKLKDNAITVEKLMFEPFMSDPTRRAIPNVFDVVSEDVGGSLEYIFLDRSKVGIAGRLEGLPGTPTGDADRLAAALRNDEGLDLFDHYKRLAKESGYLDDMENGFGRIREWDINLPGVIGQTGPGNWARVASNDPTQWESQFDALLRRNLEGVTPQKPVEMHQLFKDVEEYASRRLDEMLEGLPGTQLGRSIEGWDYGNNLAKEMADEGMPVSNQDLHDGLYEYYSDAYDMVHPMEGLGGHPGAPSQPEIVVTGIGDELSQLNKRNWIEARIEQFHDLYPYARRQPDAGESLNLARDPALAPRDRDIAEAETMFNDIFDIIKRHKDPTIPRATYEDTAILNLRNRWDTYSSEEQDSAYRFYLEGIREEWRPYDIDDLTESEIDEFLAATLRYQTTGIHLTRESQDALYRTDWLDLDELKRADIEETWRRMHPDQALRRETDPLDEIEDIANVMRWWNEGGGSSYLEGLPGTPEGMRPLPENLGEPIPSSVGDQGSYYDPGPDRMLDPYDDIDVIEALEATGKSYGNWDELTHRDALGMLGDDYPFWHRGGGGSGSGEDVMRSRMKALHEGFDPPEGGIRPPESPQEGPPGTPLKDLTPDEIDQIVRNEGGLTDEELKRLIEGD